MQPTLSIIIPVRNEEKNVPILAEQLREILATTQTEYEVLFIDDGSTDTTFSEIQKQSDRFSNFKGFRFRRTFGQTTAIRAGFDHAKGSICITLDGDLQHDPKYIPDLLKAMDKNTDVVCSYRDQRNDALIRRFPSKLANAIARTISSVKVRDFGSTYRAYRVSVIRNMPLYGEMHRFIPVFASMVSNRITEIPIKVSPRLHGNSNYGIGRTFRVASDLVLLLFFSKFFYRPIHIFGYIALALGLPGFCLLLVLTFRKLVWGIPIMNYGPLFILGVILCLVAGQLFTTGIVCEYLVRILFNPAGSKPYSVAEETVDGSSTA